MNTPAECPKCYLPWDDSAWRCDGCGFELTKDFDAVRASLRAQLASSRGMFLVALVVEFVLGAVMVYLALHGWIYLSVPVLLGAVSFTGYRAHRISVLRGHLKSLDRRHVPLPKATVHQD